MTNIPMLAKKASEIILNNLKGIPESEKQKVRDRLSTRKTTVRAGKFFSEGLNEFFRNNYEGSVSALKKAIEADDSFADPHFLLAFIYASKGQYEAAQKEYEEIIERSPEDLKALASLADLFVIQEKLKEAASVY